MCIIEGMEYNGLTSTEVSERLKEFGSNVLVAQKKRSLVGILIAQFSSFLVLLLIIAAGVSFAFHEYIDGTFILVIVVLNGLLGFYQEFKAEKAVEALATMAESPVRVLRDGKEQEIASTEIVPGDIVVLSEGDKIVADGVVVESRALEVNESALTGESAPVEKLVHQESGSLDLEQADNLFMGTLVVKGHGVMEVKKTGMRTKFGKIAETLSGIEDRETPLQKQLSGLGIYLGIAAIVTCMVVFGVGLIKGVEFLEILLLSISLAVAAVPEGLPAVVTITLALGVSQMARRKAIVRKLSAVETLGSVQVICTDKTGTLTTNRMSVRECWVHEQASLEQLVTVGVVCNTAKIVEKEGKEQILGDTTEGALLLFAREQKEDFQKLRDRYNIVCEFPFDSNRKMMSVVVKDELDGNVVLAKGAPEVMIEKSNLSEDDKRLVHVQVERMAEQGLRTLGFGKKKANDTVTFDQNEVESGLTFLGIVGIADPPRMEVKEALKSSLNAGVRTIMVTGDNIKTARAIAVELGMINSKSEILSTKQIANTNKRNSKHPLVLEGEVFAGMSDKEIVGVLDRIAVVARCQPEDKLRLVQLLQKKGFVIASTGDGVNDALHIKQADIGIAMGITGTDVSKEAADMVLADDNYATIVAAIEEGRRIYRNIVKAVHYLVSTNIGEILTILGAILIFPDGASPFTPAMILWINLITDGLPALVLATDVAEPDLMSNKPRARSGAIIERKDWLVLFGYGLLMATIAIGLFGYGRAIGDDAYGRTLAFVSLVIMQMLRMILIRKAPLFSNPRIVGVLLLTAVVQVFVSFWEPTRVLLGISG